MEIKYTGKGARKPTTSTDPSVYNLTLHYIDVPVSVNIRIKQIGSAELGLVPGYLFSAKGEDSGGYFPSSDYLVTFKKFDFSFMMGINIRLVEKLRLNFRYTYSLLSIRPEKFENGVYTWFGNLFGPKTGQYNNCLLAGLYFQLK
jgi:hypothetical protein